MFTTHCYSANPGYDLEKGVAIYCIPGPELAVLIPAASPQGAIALHGQGVVITRRRHTNPGKNLSECRTIYVVSGTQLSNRIMAAGP